MQAVPGGPKPAPGVNVILDLVGASHFPGNLDALTVEGKLLLVGMPSGMKSEINLATVCCQQQSISLHYQGCVRFLIECASLQDYCCPPPVVLVLKVGAVCNAFAPVVVPDIV